MAAAEGNEKQIEYFCDFNERIVDTNWANWNGRTLLSLAAYGRHVEIVRELLYYGVEINSRDRDDRTALALAAYQGSIATVDELIAQEGIEIDTADNTGNISLALAASRPLDGNPSSLVRVRVGSRCEHEE